MEVRSVARSSSSVAHAHAHAHAHVQRQRQRPRQHGLSALRRWDNSFLLVALFPLAYLFYRNSLLASRVIDGTRWFLLDDDMMISMRYARNLAEGNGLVWNPGEHVEGYTNFLWTIVMAGVHLFRASDPNIALLVKGVNFGLLTASLYLAIRLLRIFAPRSLIATPLLLVSLVTCADVLLWSVWGFETTLLGFLNLLFVFRVAQQKHDLVAYGALALIPLTRGDGVYVFAGNALIALLLSKAPKRTLVYLALAVVPTALHFAFRRSYYGDWLPNTYYLKVHGLEDAYKRGTLYARNFLLHYSVVLTLATGSALAIARTDRRGLILLLTVVPTLGWVVLVGGDMFVYFRFFAHVMPIVFVFATAGVVTLARGMMGRAAWVTVLFIVSFPLVRPLERLVFLDLNGDPLEQIQVAMLLKKNARPDSSVAVITAGIVPYFTRMKAIDILGKSDRHIARLTPFKGAMVGHGKLDPDWTLGKQPDFVISCRSYAFTLGLTPGTRTADPVLSFLASTPFQAKYRPFPVNEEFLLARTTLYTHAGSKEEPARQQWKKIDVSP